MTWETYYERFYDWAESTQVSYMSKLESFGPSAEICEIAQEFFEEKNASRLVKKALAAGVAFSVEEVLDLDGVVDETLMPQLIKSIRKLTAEELEEVSYWLSDKEFRVLAKKNHIRVDEYGLAVSPEEEELERQLEREEQQAQEELERMQVEWTAQKEENILLAKLMIAISRSKRRERRKKKQKA